MNPVGQALIDTGTLRRDHGGDDEVNIADEKQDDNRERGGERRRPLILAAVEVEPQQGAGNEEIDPR